MTEMTQLSSLLLILAAHVGRVCAQDECVRSSCHPSVGDLMVGRAAQLSSTSTCGLERPDKYCIISYLQEEQKCFICDSRHPYHRVTNRNSHRIHNVITTFEPERKMKWWQSENGVHEVSVQLDLETLFQFSHLVLTFKSFRPAAMLVERSKDYGKTWKVFRYFAEDCGSWFPGVSESVADSIDDIICDNRYSGAEPSTDGEVVLKALDPSFHISDPYTPAVQELITITNLRVNFTRLLTLGDTLLKRRRRKVEEKYYYALYEMVVRGSCFCNGHASQCVSVNSSRGDVPSQPGMIHGRCVCQHHTAGDNCERCQDLYNDAPWKPAGPNRPNACKQCNCNGHSQRCHFDLALYIATAGLHGGVCDDCAHNRDGPYCERCKSGFYLHHQSGANDPDACIPCDCHPDGSHGDGSCDPHTGRCLCKKHVEGQRCDTCRHGFYGLQKDNPHGCQKCPCNHLGSVVDRTPCDPFSGQCFCQPYSTGSQCDQCLSGYWGLGNTVHNCSPCDCDVGGAYTSMCSSVDGQCQCRPNIVGRRCRDPKSGHFLAPLDFYLYEAESISSLNRKASLVDPTSIPTCEQYFRENGYDFQYKEGRFILLKRSSRRKRQQQNSLPVEPGFPLQIIPQQRQPGRPVTWTGVGFVRVQDGAGLVFTVDNLPQLLDYNLVIRYEPESTEDWTASVKILPVDTDLTANCPTSPTETMSVTLSGSSRVAVLEQAVCLSKGVVYDFEITFEKGANAGAEPSKHILIDSMGLIPKLESLQDFCSANDVRDFQRYQCVEAVSQAGPQILPEVCESLISSLSMRIHNGAVACRCHPLGSRSPSCAKLGGQCDCRAHVIGRCCDACEPLAFGLGADGCTPCVCDPSGSVSELCDQRSGQCVCRRGVSGRRCDRCRSGYFGFPQCRPCVCNGLAEVCDPITGVCVDCHGNATGTSCERCLPGYYGDPTLREPCEPCLCPGSVTSGRFFALSCSKDPNSLHAECDCTPGHTGVRCDTCSPGFHGNLAVPGARCQECQCNNNIDRRDGDACHSVTGECLRCLHDTHGSRCQACRPGYYGNAVAQDCKACSCDPRGTETSSCPAGGPCVCQPDSGQCVCRPGVDGSRCDQCTVGYWDFGGASGCRPCDCHPVNSYSNQCDMVSGQCPCRPEFGGRQCTECGENHFGNPELQCISCDCNMDGAGRPACDSYTGECLCRPGVIGTFCDQCAPGHDPSFPACTACHPCAGMWGENVTQMQQDINTLNTWVGDLGDEWLSTDYSMWQQLVDLLADVEKRINDNSESLQASDQVEMFCMHISMLKDEIDPNLIMIDVTPLLDSEIGIIKNQFNKLLEKLTYELKPRKVVDVKAVEEAWRSIRDDHREVLEADKLCSDAQAVLKSSGDTCDIIKEKLRPCRRNQWDRLERKVKSLRVPEFIRTTCEPRGDSDCSEGECDGVLCHSVRITQQTGRDISEALHKLTQSDTKLRDVKQKTMESKAEAELLQQRVSDSKERLEKSKAQSRALLQRVKDYLTDEMVLPEDIDKVSSAVLNLQLPTSSQDVQNIIQQIRQILNNSSELLEEAEHLQKQTQEARQLLENAQHVLNKTKSIDSNAIKEALADVEKTQENIREFLAKNCSECDQIIKEIRDKLDGIEESLTITGMTDLLGQMEVLKNKSEMNEQLGTEAKAMSDSAMSDAAEAETALQEVEKLFGYLKSKVNDSKVKEAMEARVKTMRREATEAAAEVEEKMKQLTDLEARIRELLQRKEDKEQEVAKLLQTVNEIRLEISDRANAYSICTS